MRPVLGMPALIELSSVEENALLCQELGLSFVELNMNMPYCFPENLAPAKLRRLAEETGIYFSLHMPDDTDFGSLHKNVRQGTLDRALEAVEWAADADIRLLNFHINPGIYFTLPSYRVWIFDKYYPEFETNIVDSFTQLLDKARSAGIKLCVENVFNFDIPFIQRVLEPLTKLPDFHLTWDVGHDAKTAFKERGTLLKHEKNLAHMHLHDYDGKTDHQVLFKGHLDIISYVQFAASHDMDVVVEVKTIDALVQSINELNRRLP
jgi:sugar phosphate isomerase/epimerase